MTLCSNLAVAAIVASMLLTGTAFGEGVGPGLHGTGWGGPILRSVGLTDAQKAQIHQIMASHRPQFRALREQLRAARSQLGDQLYGTNPVTPAALAPLVQQIDTLRERLAQERLQAALEIRGVLTSDQVAKAAQTRLQLNQLRSQMRTLLNPGP